MRRTFPFKRLFASSLLFCGILSMHSCEKENDNTQPLAGKWDVVESINGVFQEQYSITINFNKETNLIFDISNFNKVDENSYITGTIVDKQVKIKRQKPIFTQTPEELPNEITKEVPVFEGSGYYDHNKDLFFIEYNKYLPNEENIEDTTKYSAVFSRPIP